MYCKDCGKFWEECQCDEEPPELGGSDSRRLLDSGQSGKCAFRAVETSDKLPKVRIRETRYGLVMSVCHNGYQWTEFSVDGDCLDVIEEAIAIFREL